MIISGHNMTALARMEDCSVDAVVTDPPYGLSFMGQKWDYDVPSVELWAECLRVLKPGGHLLAFAGTRTQHRMAVRIEDAGFEIRDMIAWVYGSGFPKSLNVGAVLPEWEGWGTGLKPAIEPITMARKPFKKTVAQNVTAYGTGALNIDACRVERKKQPGGWPSNLIHDGSDEVLEAMPNAPGALAPVTGLEPTKAGFSGPVYGAPGKRERKVSDRRDGGGSAARFFYCAKASRSEKEAGLEELEAKQRVYNGQSSKSAGMAPESVEAKFTTAPAKNYHPTVKPIELMRYLIRLVTPPGGLVLDPFAGSGTTGCAAVLEGMEFIGLELFEEFAKIAELRIAYWEREQRRAARLPLFSE